MFKNLSFLVLLSFTSLIYADRSTFNLTIENNFQETPIYINKITLGQNETTAGTQNNLSAGDFIAAGDSGTFQFTCSSIDKSGNCNRNDGDNSSIIISIPNHQCSFLVHTITENGQTEYYVSANSSFANTDDGRFVCNIDGSDGNYTLYEGSN